MGRSEARVEILLVEDNEADDYVMREIFGGSRNPKTDRSQPRGGRLGLATLPREIRGGPRPDLMLLDIGLPEMRGLDVSGEAKGVPDLRRITIIILTTSKTEKDLFKSYDLHANNYITNPFYLSGLFEVVREIEQFWFGTVNLSTEVSDTCRTKRY